MSDTPRPKWYGTARGFALGRRRKPARPAPQVFSEQPEPEKALGASSWAGTGEGRGENGLFAPGNPGSGIGNAAATTVLRAKRKFKQIIDDEHPNLMRDVVNELAHIALEGDTHGDRLKAIQLLMDRYWGKLREHKTINRVGGSTQSVNVAIFGADGAAILEAVQSPEDRQRLAAAIHQWQLEQPEGSSNGQENGTEVCTGPDILVQGSDEAGA